DAGDALQPGRPGGLRAGRDDAPPEGAGMSVLAEIQDLRVRFGGVAAADGLSFDVNAGEFLAVIGPNGAGKTTALKMVAGLQRPDSGRVIFRGEDVTRLPVHARVRRGMGFTHQIVRPFYGFSTVENVMLAA